MKGSRRDRGLLSPDGTWWSLLPVRFRLREARPDPRRLRLLRTLSLLLLLVTAISSALTPEDQVVSDSGLFVVMWGDPLPGVDADPVSGYVLFPDRGETVELLIPDDLLRSLGGPLALNRRRVQVGGRLVTDPHVAIQVEALRYDSPEDAAAAASKPRLELIGSRRHVTILCRFADSTGLTPHPKSFYETLTGSSSPGLDDFWRDISYENLNLDGSVVVGWYDLPRTRAEYLNDPQTHFDGSTLNRDLSAQECAAAADADVVFPNFDGVNFIFNQNPGCCAWGGGTRLNLDGVEKDYAATWQGPSPDQRAFGHQLGHSYGLPHSSGPYLQTYDSAWDLESQGSMCRKPHPKHGCLGVQVNSFHKDLLGWIPGPARFEAVPGSIRTILLTPLSDPWTGGGQHLMAKIPIGGSATEFYTVEVRRFVDPHDDEIPADGVVIHRVDTARSDRNAQVVDPDQDGDPNDEGAIWAPGETFRDPHNGVTVSVDAETSLGFQVTISLDRGGEICDERSEDAVLPPPAPSTLPELAAALPDIAVLRTYLMTDLGGGGIEVPNPVPGETVFFHLDGQVTGTAAALPVSSRVLLDGATFCEGTLPESAGSWTAWCNVPWVVEAGVHTFRWELDYTETIAEKNELNNVASRSWPATLDIETQRAYLVDSFGRFEVSVPSVGQSIEFHLDYQVTGFGGPTDFSVRALLDGSPFCAVDLAGAAPGESGFVSCPPWIATPGTHTLRWTMDHSDNVPETDESNNSARANWQTLALDLQANGAYLRTAVGGGGDRVYRPTLGQTVYFGLDWQAVGITHPTLIGMRADLDGVTFCSCDQLVPVGDPTQLISSCPIPWIATVGSHLLTWSLDPSNHLSETDETNATISLLIQVAPANDDCTSRTVIPDFSFIDSVVTSGAASSPDDPVPPCGNSTSARSVWYEFTAPGTGTIDVDTVGSDYDTILSAWTGDCGSLTAVPGACNDDIDASTLQSGFIFAATAGTTYLFMVSDFDGIGGNLSFNFSFVPELPANDACGDATELSWPATAAAFTVGAGTGLDDPTPSCGNGSRSKSIWYRFTAPGPGTLTVDTFGSDYNTILSAWEGACGALTAVPGGCNDDSGGGSQSQIQIALPGIRTHYFMVSAFAGDGGSLILNLNFQPHAGEVPDGSEPGIQPLTLTHGTGGDIILSWSPSCLVLDTDYIVYEGVMGDFTSHTPVLCSTLGATTVTLTPSSGSTYYLVVPRTDFFEGSYGRQSDGTERPAGVGACLSQAIGSCGPSCAHDKCTVGVALDPTCDADVAALCTVDPFCCTGSWDSICVEEVRTVLGSLTCPESAGSCSHTLCNGGDALVSGCDDPPVTPSCTAAICTVDPACCTTSWDSSCVGEVSSVCGFNCN